MLMRLSVRREGGINSLTQKVLHDIDNVSEQRSRCLILFLHYNRGWGEKRSKPPGYLKSIIKEE